MEEKNNNYNHSKFIFPQIFSDILDFNVNIDAQLTSKANFMFGASTFVLLFSVNKIFPKDFFHYQPLLKLSWFIILFGSFISSILAIMIVLPKIKRFTYKQRQGLPCLC